ncbi:WD repeat-containing protein 43-like [Ornithodoros turicata]|uniref:WD repeat-containing protein 43-like n=1 Tax=Ornithodoros turicata TaxID=34597 RepID=UPI003139533B
MATFGEPVAVSNNGDLLAYSTPDGRLKLWETASGKLKQEYTPSSHLSATCTCLSWGPTRHDFASPKKKKRQKTSNDVASTISEVGLLAMGTASGTVLLYSVAKGDLHAELSDGHSDTVNGLSWHPESDFLFSCSDDQHIVHWSVSKYKVKSKWKADRRSVYAVSVVDSQTLLSASSSIKWWNIETQTVIMKFTGHITEVRHLLPVILPNKDKKYFLSSAVNDRQLSAWTLQEGSSTSSLASFTLSDEARHLTVSQADENGQVVYLSAVTRSGLLHMFELQLNGKCKTPVQPKFTVQIASDTRNGQSERPQSLPILAAHLVPDDPGSVLLCYGTFLRPSFERLSITDNFQTQTWLVRQLQSQSTSKQEVESSVVKQPQISSKDVKSLAPGHMTPSVSTVKTKTPVSKLPMEERLKVLDSEEWEEKDEREPPRADNLCQLLSQGLQSDDDRLLSSVLDRSDETLIRNTVRRLPITSVLALLRELHKRMHRRGARVSTYMKWIKTIIVVHTSFLTTCKEATTLLNPLVELLEARTEVFDKLCRLRGRLDLIMSQVTGRNEDSLQELPSQPLCVLQEESSDEEMEGSEDSEDEDMWGLSNNKKGQEEEEEDMDSSSQGEEDTDEERQEDEDKDSVDA